jgi:hypothetical protein
MPTPVRAVNHAAMHKGHFGRKASKTPGSIEVAALVPVER